MTTTPPVSSRMICRLAVLVFFGIFAQPFAFSQKANNSHPVASQTDIVLAPQMILPHLPEPLKPAQLTQMDVSARIVGLNAEVTTTMTFLNPNKRALEGDLVFPLPENAGITGYALDIQGRMVDGVVVKKEKARIAFETEVKRGVDPGLVEHVAGNVFRTRVYPLPANGTRQVRVRYVAQLPVDAKGDAAWHLPMPIGETIGKLGIRVEVSQGEVKPDIGGFGNLRFESLENIWVAKTEIKDAKPGEDLWVALPKLPPQVATVERAKDGVYFSVSDVPPAVEAELSKALPPKSPGHIGIAWDASGSRGDAKGLQTEISMLKKLLASWPDTSVTLLVFRDRTEEPRVFEAADRDTLFKTLADLTYDGGTDLSLVPESMNKIENIDQWFLFTDGLDTLSGSIPVFGKQPITAVVNETVADRELLEQACAATGGQLIDLQNLDADAGAAAAVNPPLRLVAVHGDGITNVQGIGQVVHGRAAISGKLTGDEAELTLEYSNGKQSPPIKITKKDAPAGDLLATVWAGRRIRQLSVRADDNDEELLTLGRQYGIVSPATSLIVLDTLDQYVRNEIEPPVSMPELREQWANTMETRKKTAAKTRQERLDQLLALWNGRLQWWNTQFKPGKFKQEDMRKQDADREAAEDEAMSPTTPAAVTGAPAPVGEALAFAGRSAAADAPGGSGNSRSNLAFAGANADMTVAGEGGLTWDGKSERPGGNALTIAIKAWDPNTPYLSAIKDAKKEDRYTVYLKQRGKYATSPAFFLDCADYFFKEGDKEIATRILTNLAEMKLEDAPLLRVLAWRFEQAGEQDRAIVVLRKVMKLRPDEAQSLRDLALALTERGKAAKGGKTLDISEALGLEDQLLFGNWARNDEIELPVLEEMNALIAWIHTRPWNKSPIIPELDERLVKNMDVDVRIVLSWDADSTDVDLHVVEPTGEEAYYQHNRTLSGGLVSHDVTQGYGPEEYLMHRALPGEYRIFAQYYGSSQQNVTGAVTVTATVFTNYGRPNEKKEVLTLRLDTVKENVPIGKIQFEAAKEQPAAPATGAAGKSSRPRTPAALSSR